MDEWDEGGGGGGNLHFPLLKSVKCQKGPFRKVSQLIWLPIVGLRVLCLTE